MNWVETVLFPLTLAGVLSCGLVAGIFFAFSNFVMGALEKIQAEAGMSAMQAINITVLNPLFFGCFFGAAVISLILGSFSLIQWQHPGAVYLLLGSLVYLGGCFLVTVAANVPLNEALKRVAPHRPESVGFWREYVCRWRRWNHLRTLASFLAAAFYAIGLALLG
ncbi:DUF1772 domain-containing protein [Shewanella salipaludis]|uniref:DUF1772 domain-containing protein n=1 Tax=Shewanella salipaludis TaxID=2723052 RepID=A0A972FVR1_9GAMM|nr:anthrone oxygenase family protein [Shewanella salipaludis]NMH64138.1 DUF1772 domain-containing protein [Shewanella salipaludis]